MRIGIRFRAIRNQLFFPEIYKFPAQIFPHTVTSVWNGYTRKFGLGLGREYLIECLRYRASSHTGAHQFASGASQFVATDQVVETLNQSVAKRTFVRSQKFTVSSETLIPLRSVEE
jgi:hypothetical protein